jgi:adenylate cyclase class 2
VSLEQEIKLRFESLELAREAVRALGAIALRPRRFQDDVLLDTEDGRLARQGCALRVRRDGQGAAVTWKGPVLPALVKSREEIESVVASADGVEAILARLGFVPRFRYQKFREEYTLDGLVAAIDETPVGIYVELEGSEAAITRTAAALGRTPADYIRASYRTLFLEHQRGTGSSAPHMVFSAS